MRLKRALVLIGTVGLILAAAAGYWLAWAPNTPSYEGTRVVKLPPTSSFESVLDSLETNGIVASSFTFKSFAALTGWYQQVKPGRYAFEAGRSNYQMMSKLRRGAEDPVHVTIPPATRPSIVATILARDLDIDSSAVRRALRDSTLAARLEINARDLFGYLLPDTYQIYWRTRPEAVIARLKHTLDRRFTNDMHQQAAQLGLSKEDVIILASIIEWETSVPGERATIAGVYLNRLEAGMPLQADPTVQYALMQQGEDGLQRLYYKDYQLDHPYNTYKYRGLPPGPITNPRLSTIEAVLNAKDHDYYYFVADGSGGHVFSETYEQHLRAARKFRRLMRERRRADEKQTERSRNNTGGE